jgi:hypothetical protein
MYYTLGDTIFTGAFGPSAVSAEYGAPLFAQQQPIGGKAILQDTGTGLNRFGLTLFLDFSFTNVPSALAELRGYMDARRVVDYSAGNGEFFGTFVLTKMAVTELNRNPRGELVTASVAVDLLEYVDADPEASRRRRAVTEAVAVTENGVIPVRVTALPTSPTGQVVSTLGAGMAAGLEGALIIERAVMFSPERESLLNQAEAIYKVGRDKVAEGISAAANVQTLAARAPTLLADMEAVKSAMEVAVGAAKTGDLTNARAAASNVVAASDVAATSSRFLSVDLITRRA